MPRTNTSKSNRQPLSTQLTPNTSTLERFLLKGFLRFYRNTSSSPFLLNIVVSAAILLLLLSLLLYIRKKSKNFDHRGIQESFHSFVRWFMLRLHATSRWINNPWRFDVAPDALTLTRGQLRRLARDCNEVQDWLTVALERRASNSTSAKSGQTSRRLDPPAEDHRGLNYAWLIASSTDCRLA